MKSWKWWHIVALVLEIAGIAAVILTMATDGNDDVLLPVALACIGGANVLMLVKNIQQYRNRGK